MICYVIKAAKDCNTEALCVVVGHKAEEVKKAIGNRDVTFTLQQQQLGTGHAVMQAIDFIEDDKNILILYGDTPLITKRKFRGIAIIPRKKKIIMFLLFLLY